MGRSTVKVVPVPTSLSTQISPPCFFTIPRDTEGERAYAGVLTRIAAERQLPPFRADAVAVLIEHGSRIGLDPDEDRRNWVVTPSGIVVMPRGRTPFFARGARGFGIGYQE